MDRNIEYIASVEISDGDEKNLIEYYLEKVTDPLSYYLLFKIGTITSINTNSYHYLTAYSFQHYNDGRDFIFGHYDELTEEVLYVCGKTKGTPSMKKLKETAPSNDTPTNKEEKETAPSNDMSTTKEEDYEMVNHPQHYNLYSEETIEIMKDVYGPDAVALWSEMTAFKYRMRMGTKPGSPVEQDLEKEEVYLGFRDYYKTDNYQNLLKQLKNAD